MKITDFDYTLPEDRISLRPRNERSGSRLLVLHRDGFIEHRLFSDLPSYIENGDMLILNNTKVIPARLKGRKKGGGYIEILLVQRISDEVWEVLSRGSYTGRVRIAEDFEVDLHRGKIAHFHFQGDFMENIWKYGFMPLPPYIKRLPDEYDKGQYQTVYAREEGSIAAPTAGLHFTDDLLREITRKGVSVKEITLHVGTGTFKPIRSDTLEEHQMDAEHFELDAGLLQEIGETKKSGKRVFAVGTTSTRALEGYMSGRCSIVSRNGKIQGTTDIFLYPGYVFKAVDSLVTNFHLPRSTPLMLASAKCGWDCLLKAYKEALAGEYRFLSYGDAMLIL
jgi:S-adenosylmethionine:tRNA ribosyltransferase-isomerase